MNKNQLYRRVREIHDHCPHCGATDGLQVHHRKNRGMGGSKILDRFENLIRVCAQLNYAMESDAIQASEARDMGWKLGQWDGFDMPYFDRPAGQWFLLTKDGQKVPVDAPMYLI